MQGLAFGFIFTYFFLKVTIPFLLIHAPDKPNQRSSHEIVTPGSGGVAFILPFLIFIFLEKEYFWFLCLPLAIISLVDDRIKLSAYFRLFAQFFTVFLIINNTFNFNFLDGNPFIYILFIFLLFFGTAIINFVNFIDGIDGLISGCFIFIFLFGSITFNQSLYALTASLIAFIIFNWMPAKVFMGDVGSIFLGSIFVIIIYSQDNIMEGIKYLSLGSPIFFDALITVLRRFSYKQNIFRAHKSHLFQRLYQVGWSHAKISSIYISSTGVIFLAAISNNYVLIFGSVILTFLVGLILEFKYALPFEKSF